MHYLIDLDNTLLDTFFFDKEGRVNFYWSQDFSKDFGLSPKVLKDLFCEPFLSALRQTKKLDAYIDPFLKKYNIPLSAKEFLEYWLSRDSRVNERVYHWIEEKHNQGHHFHIASNQPHIRMDYIWDKYPNWHNVFEHIFTSARMGVAKPDPEFFKLVQKTLNVLCSEIALIDDDIDNITSAKALGMKQSVLFKDLGDIKDFMIYIEYGLDFDNNPFGIGRSVEIENDNGTEYRTKKNVKIHNKSYYFRLWIGKKVLVISNKGFEIVNKNRRNLKIVFGIKGNTYNLCENL